MSFLVRIKRSRDETPRRSLLVSPPLKKRPCLNDVRLLEYFDSIEDGEQLAGVVQKSLALGRGCAPKTVLEVPASYEERIYETTKREEVRGALLKFKDQHNQTNRQVVEVNDEKVVVVDLERKRLGGLLEADSKRIRKRSREEQFVFDVYRVSTSFDAATEAYSKEHMLADHVLDLLRNDDEIMFAELNANESLFYSGGLTSDSEPYEDESLHTQSDYPEASSSHETFDVDKDQMDYTSEIPDSGSDNDRWRVRDFLDGIDKAPVELDALTSEDSDVFDEDPFALQYHNSAPAFPEAPARVRDKLVERHLDDPDDWMSRLMALEKAEEEWESKRKKKAVKSQNEVRKQIREYMPY
ncbi:MAG: uncharacterized protein KVP18_004896 [Porospora cf. gigantea A]|uniref:uncharacterized protein n=1 Tax=Porospora cf. gigantea A TaxID=2853593 RepID=UPI003559EBD2|nr:MAG: hypothetical protein KVP18_004896 [Porospora cf. gigantea A]